ncbi:MAG: S9 family peptidase, partial [Brevundimonas sp.]
MKSFILLSAAVPALLLAAGPALALAPVDPAAVAATNPPPHFPRDLSPEGVKAADDHLALEEVDGAEAMAFVAAENAKSLAALTGDRRYEGFRQQAEAILTATDRIPAPSFLGDGVGNFWQDAANPKGVWRRTSLASYRTATPQWETLLDIDALAKAEGRDWVFKGANCLAPDETRCLINLSDGGKDAVVVREFDLTTKTFVAPAAGGFVIPEGKHRLDWLDRDTLLIATDFGPGTMTESGYPFIVKSLTRGHPLAHAAEVYRGQQSDGGYGVSPMVFRDKAGTVEAVLFSRPLDTFRSETWALGADGKPQKLNLPERVAVEGVMGGNLVFSPDQAWTFDGQDYAAGSLLSLPLGVLRPERLEIAIGADRATIFTPTPRQSLQNVTVFSDSIVAAIADNVVGRLKRFTPTANGWTVTDIAVPANAAVGLGDSSKSKGQVFVSTQGFLTPPTLSLADVSTAALTELKSAPAKFDASTHVVEQYEATSTDGTRIPYFITRPREMKLD